MTFLLDMLNSVLFLVTWGFKYEHMIQKIK